MNSIVIMFLSKVKEDTDALFRYFVEHRPVLRYIVKPSNSIVNMFLSKVKEDNDALVRCFVEHRLVLRDIVKPSNSLKLQCCKL